MGVIQLYPPAKQHHGLLVSTCQGYDSCQATAGHRWSVSQLGSLQQRAMTPIQYSKFVVLELDIQAKKEYLAIVVSLSSRCSRALGLGIPLIDMQMSL